MNDKVQGGFPPEAFDGLAAQEDTNWWFRIPFGGSLILVAKKP